MGWKTVNFTVDAEIIKSRFAQRMNGNLPKPIEIMIEKQLNEWKDVIAKLQVDTSANNANEIAKKVYDFQIN